MFKFLVLQSKIKLTSKRKWKYKKEQEHIFSAFKWRIYHANNTKETTEDKKRKKINWIEKSKWGSILNCMKKARNNSHGFLATPRIN